MSFTAAITSVMAAGIAPQGIGIQKHRTAQVMAMTTRIVSRRSALMAVNGTRPGRRPERPAPCGCYGLVVESVKVSVLL